MEVRREFRKQTHVHTYTHTFIYIYIYLFLDVLCQNGKMKRFHFRITAIIREKESIKQKKCMNELAFVQTNKHIGNLHI